MKHKPGVKKLSSLPKRKAEFIEPMDCAPASKLPDGSQWVFEIKLDGYRAVAVKADGRVNLFSRRRKSFDHHYPLIVEALAGLPEGTVVDGEIVALDDSGRPDSTCSKTFAAKHLLIDAVAELTDAQAFKDVEKHLGYSPVNSGNAGRHKHWAQSAASSTQHEPKILSSALSLWAQAP